jgi:hypothetical protein
LHLEEDSDPIEPRNEGELDLGKLSIERSMQLREILIEARDNPNALPAPMSALPDRSGS